MKIKTDVLEGLVEVVYTRGVRCFQHPNGICSLCFVEKDGIDHADNPKEWKQKWIFF